MLSPAMTKLLWIVAGLMVLLFAFVFLFYSGAPIGGLSVTQDSMICTNPVTNQNVPCTPTASATPVANSN